MGCVKYNAFSSAVKGEGASFFRVIISFESGPPEVVPYMTKTFGEVFGPQNQTCSIHAPPVNKCQK